MNNIIFNIISLTEYNNSIINNIFNNDLYLFNIDNLHFLDYIKNSNLSIEQYNNIPLLEEEFKEENDYENVSLKSSNNSFNTINDYSDIYDSNLSNDFDNNSDFNNDLDDSYESSKSLSYNSLISDSSFNSNKNYKTIYFNEFYFNHDLDLFKNYKIKIENIKYTNLKKYNLLLNSLIFINLEKIITEFNKLLKNKIEF